MKITRYITGVWIILAVSHLSADIIPPVDPVDITGTIIDAEWMPERKVKGRPGYSGSLGHDRTFPAQFRAQLKDFEVNYPEKPISSIQHPKITGVYRERPARCMGDRRMSIPRGVSHERG